MNSEEVLNAHVARYLSLSAQHGQADEDVAACYRELKSLIVVELYFMKSVRRIITDDEMSGFVIFMEDRIQKIVDSYCIEKGPFLPFLKHAAENSACTYAERLNRRKRISQAEIQHHRPFMERISEPSAEYTALRKQERLEEERSRRRDLRALKAACARRPNYQRAIFIFMVTLIPFLSATVIDRICETLNYDKKQTYAIADYLSLTMESDGRQRYSRAYMMNQRDNAWMHILNLEAMASTSEDEEMQASMRFQKGRIEAMNKSIRSSGMHVDYTTLGELLNMENRDISQAVFNAKRLLMQISTKGRHKGTDKQPKRFLPFQVFGIRTIPKPK